MKYWRSNSDLVWGGRNQAVLQDDAGRYWTSWNGLGVDWLHVKHEHKAVTELNLMRWYVQEEVPERLKQNGWRFVDPIGQSHGGRAVHL